VKKNKKRRRRRRKRKRRRGRRRRSKRRRRGRREDEEPNKNFSGWQPLPKFATKTNQTKPKDLSVTELVFKIEGIGRSNDSNSLRHSSTNLTNCNTWHKAEYHDTQSQGASLSTELAKP
jgi:hypothetical protein